MNLPDRAEVGMVKEGYDNAVIDRKSNNPCSFQIF